MEVARKGEHAGTGAGDGVGAELADEVDGCFVGVPKSDGDVGAAGVLDEFAGEFERTGISL